MSAQRGGRGRRADVPDNKLSDNEKDVNGNMHELGLQDNDSSGSKGLSHGGADNSGDTAIKMLLSNKDAGSLIGRGGATIVELQVCMASCLCLAQNDLHRGGVQLIDDFPFYLCVGPGKGTENCVVAGTDGMQNAREQGRRVFPVSPCPPIGPFPANRHKGTPPLCVFFFAAKQI